MNLETAPRFRELLPCVLIAGVAIGSTLRPHVPKVAAAPRLDPLALRPESCRVKWEKVDAPARMSVGRPSRVRVQFRNLGPDVWPVRAAGTPTADGSYAIRLSYRWWDSEVDEPVGDFGGRVDFAVPVEPGGSAASDITVEPPRSPGKYTLQLDLVQELRFWFFEVGASPCFVPVEVDPA